MRDSSRRWRVGLSLAAGAWLVTIGVLIITIVRFELSGSAWLARASLWLALLAGAIAVLTAAFALRGLRRQQLIETELRRSQETFEGILTIAADAIITIDSQHRIVHFNHGAEGVFGYRAEEVRSRPLQLLIPRRFQSAHEKHIDGFGHDHQVARRMGERRAIFGIRKSGEEFPAEASISRLDVEGTRLFSVVLRDITTRVRAEERARFLSRASADLASSLEYEAALVVACHVGVPYLADCAVLDIAEASEVRRMVSVHDDPDKTRVLRRLEGRTLTPPNWPFPIAEVMNSGAPVLRRGLAAGWLRETGASDDPVRLGDLESLGIHSFITVPLSVRGRVFGTLTLVATDPDRPCGDEECDLAQALAERVAVSVDNAALYREAQRASKARDELLGVVSHDLRNPLSAITMCARVLAENPPADADERRGLASAILDSGAMMQRLIQDLLDVATIESGHLRIAIEPADPAQIATRGLNMVREQAAARGVELIASFGLPLAPVHMDAMRIEQVIANLLANAVKFTDAGGRVMLEVSEVASGLRVAVADTGIGIPADALPHIFDRFWHSRRSGRTVGTGLGLAIAKGIVAAHGGTLEVRSTVGSGSVFSFVLPDGRGELVEADGTSADHAQRGRSQ